MAVIELTGVRKRHRRRGPWVLDGVDLRLDAGQVVQVVGTNGSGKSTLVRLAAGLSRPTAGTARRLGRSAFVPEQTPAPPPMTVRDYLDHQARLHGVPPAASAARIDEIVADHRLGAAMERPMRELSKGWGQRVVIAQALLAPTAAVVLDEPFTGVDAGSRAHLLTVIEEHAARGTAVLLTSHEAMAVVGLERRVLRDGRFLDAFPQDRGRRLRRVVLLRRRDHALPFPVELRTHPAVDRVEELPGDADALGLLLDAEEGDDVLARALAAGWTIERLDTRSEDR